MSDGSGPKSGASRKRPKPAGSSSKTSRASSALKVEPQSRSSSGTWHRAGSMRNGIVSPRALSAPRTSAIDSGFSLPTPTASQYGSSQNGINGVGGENERPSAGTPSLFARARAGALPTPVARDHKGSGRDGQLPTEIFREARLRSTDSATGQRFLPTPLPTPVAGDASGRTANYPRGNPTLPGAVLPTPLASSGRQAGARTNTRSGRTLNESVGALPTPTASNARHGARSEERDNGEGPNLVEAVTRLATRPSLPTPTTRDCQATGVAGNWTAESGRNAGATLTDVVVRGLDAPSHSSGESSTKGRPTGIGGERHSARFVLWMMGLPTGWTEI